MLVTQFETLQEPGADETDVLVVDIDQPLEGVVASTIELLLAQSVKGAVDLFQRLLPIRILTAKNVFLKI